MDTSQMPNRQIVPAVEAMLDMSVTELFSIPNDEVAAIQLAGLRQHFDGMLGRTKVLRRFADEQGVARIGTLEDAAPLLFPHSVYKSYPMSALERNRFDILTRWLQTLTPHDLSGVDAAACGSIDAWIDALDRVGMKVKHSSGTTGKLSILPRDEVEAETSARIFPNMFQGFGAEPNARLEGFDELPIVLTSYRSGAMALARLMDAVTQYRRGGDPGAVIASNSGRLSADALSIGGRIRAAEAKGEQGKLQLSPDLLGRRDAFLREQAEMPTRLAEFFDDITTRLKGQRVMIITILPHLFDLAVEGLKNGVSGVFAPDSLALIGGGPKGRNFPADYRETIARFLGLPAFPPQSYGMSEMVSGGTRACPEGNYHLRPYIIPYQLDPTSGAVLPRSGTVTGRFGFVDLLAHSHWGGFLSGDETTISWPDTPCRCGRNGAYVNPDVRRYGDKEGGDDKITCAGAPEAHDKALEFIAEAMGP